MDPRLAITGLGMVTSIGHNAVSACAALRADVTRPAEIDYSVLDEEAIEEVNVTGHPLAGIADGFQGVALYAKIGSCALANLIDYGKLRSEGSDFWSQTALFICLSAARNDELLILDELMRNELPRKLLATSQLPVALKDCRVLQRGHASVLLAAKYSVQLIEQRRFERCIVLGIDSLVDRDSLSYFVQAGRLKTATITSGLMPGEAGAAVLIERPATAERRAGRIEAYLGAVATETGPSIFLDDNPASGVALSNTLLAVMGNAKGIQDIYVDLNGEDRRARDWGLAVVRVQAALGYFPGKIRVPALNLGDTGAASGAIAIAAATRAFVRGYAGGTQTLVCSTAETGETAAAMVRAP